MHTEPADLPVPLSDTRRRVLELLPTGLSYAAIGRALGISKARVGQHVAELRRLGLTSERG